MSQENLDAGKVVVRIDWQVRGRSSGAEMDFDATSINTMDGGRILRQQWYFDHEEVRSAVGLSE